MRHVINVMDSGPIPAKHRAKPTVGSNEMMQDDLAESTSTTSTGNHDEEVLLVQTDEMENDEEEDEVRSASSSPEQDTVTRRPGGGGEQRDTPRVQDIFGAKKTEEGSNGVAAAANADGDNIVTAVLPDGKVMTASIEKNVDA